MKPATRGPAAGAAAIAVAIIGLLALHEGNKLVPYYDQAGVLTVCKGITGPDVVKGRIYTQAQCDALETKYVAAMVERMSSCVAVPLSDGEWIAYGHWSYNVGTTAFCNSGVVRELNAGRHESACRQMARWTYITKPGRGKVNCRDPKEKCGGLPKRRDYEVKMCLEAL